MRDAAPEQDRRRATAVCASLAIHGVLLLLMLMILPAGVAEEPRPAPQLSVIDIDVGPRPPERPQLLAALGAGAPGTPAPARSTVSAGRRGRRGHAAPAHVQAPPVSDPFAELSVAYEAGDPDASRPGSGAGDDGDGPGAGALGTGGGLGFAGPLGLGAGGSLRVPAAPPSQARGPRPKHDYARWAYRPPSEYGDKNILLELSIDARGRVSGVRVLQGTGGPVDDRAIALARGFEFYPALDGAGEPTAGVHRWEFVIEGQINFGAALQR